MEGKDKIPKYFYNSKNFARFLGWAARFEVSSAGNVHVVVSLVMTFCILLTGYQQFNGP